MSRVTVVIPNYNGLRFMEPCMSALKAQTYTDFCVLIVDNGSTDGSAEWIRSLADKDSTLEAAGSSAGSAPSLIGIGLGKSSTSALGSPISDSGVLRGHIGSMEVNSILLSENTGFAGAAMITVPFTVPPIINAYLTTAGSIGAVITQIICIIVSILIYIPFVQALNRQQEL